MIPGLLFLFAVADPAAWDALLQRYVNEEHRVDYARWHKQDIPALDAYIAQLAAPWPRDLSVNDQKAALINSYNALTIRWILTHYPVASIWKTKKPFREARHTINGEKVSLDALETRLRKTGDARIHAALVCAARACPPLRREAYTADRLNEQLDANTRAWLADPKLNTFEPSGKADVSMIFKWYRNDFPDLARFLAEFAPTGAKPARITHKSYHWGLNDASPLGENYGTSFYLDALRNR